MTTRRAAAEAQDDADPLAPFRARFVGVDDDVIYLDGNSLGRLPLATRDRLQRAVDIEWGRGLVGSWPAWADLPVEVGDRLGAAALGAGPGQVLVCDSTSVNLYKLTVAAVEARPGRSVVVTDDGNFPGDRYVLEGVCAQRGLELRVVPRLDDVASALGGDVALVSLSHVNYATAEVADMASITAAAHHVGALALWDVCHSAGALVVDLDGSGADLAVGCTYKYLNAGPGAPAFLYVRRDLQGLLRQPVWGWFGQRDQFAMGPRYEPQPDIRRFQAGTPPVLGVHAVDVGAALVADAGVERLAAKGRALTALAIDLVDDWLAPLGFDVITPRAPGRRGAHVALRHPDAWQVCQGLVERARVVPDFREPDVLRLGFAAASTRFVDVWDALDRLRRLVSAGDHRAYPTVLGRVT